MLYIMSFLMMRHGDATWQMGLSSQKSSLTEAPDVKDRTAPGDAAARALETRLRREYEAQLGRIDHTTMLPNRARFIEDMGGFLCTPEAHDKQLVMTLVTLADAKHFNEILRALGHAYSEDFIRAGAERLKSVLGETQIYHVSVLSFAFLVEAKGPGHTPPPVIEAIARAFRGSLICRSIPIDTVVGVGLTRLDPVVNEPAELLRTTLAAAQDSRSKPEGWAWYNKKSDDAHMRAFRLLTDLKPAIESSDQLYLNFQPRICLRSEKAVSAEALIRWQHPTLGVVSPGEFMPLVEATALIKPLTRLVADMAISQIVQWRARAIEMKLSINISPKNLMEDDFVDYILESCAEADVAPEEIELEFTEGTVSADNKIAMERLGALNAAGIEIAIDDFGSGYSNMSYLTLLPAQVLKIDQSFIRPLDTRPKNEILIRSIIDLGHSLGYRIVAEGIETETSYQRLADWGCDEGQGYFMSRPLGVTPFSEWFGAHR